jgi:chemotaxis protein CheD
MKAHIYGGATIHRNMQPIGQRNSELAERFLNTENIIISHRDVGGGNARRVDFLAASGKARCRHVDGAAAPAVKPMPVPSRSVGDVEFF